VPKCSIAESVAASAAMAKPEQVLLIDPPNELVFRGPFTTSVSALMKLSNPSDKKVCFKIKTTAPKRYCVKPNSGVIDPRQSIQISVSLQPFDFDPAEKNRHQFMVQAMYAPDGEINQDTLWKETIPDKFMDSKLKCVFFMPDENNAREDASFSDSSNREPIANEMHSVTAGVPPSPKSFGFESDRSSNARPADEIRKLQEENSALRHENIQLKEEALRLKRLAASRDSTEGESASSPLSSSGGGSRAGAGTGYSSTVATASNPNALALQTVYLYAALIVLVLGIVIGKWIL
jgi:hypothetical protein